MEITRERVPAAPRLSNAVVAQVGLVPDKTEATLGLRQTRHIAACELYDEHRLCEGCFVTQIYP